jgi:hypothetical protein
MLTLSIQDLGRYLTTHDSDKSIACLYDSCPFFLFLKHGDSAMIIYPDEATNVPKRYVSGTEFASIVSVQAAYGVKDGKHYCWGVQCSAQDQSGVINPLGIQIGGEIEREKPVTFLIIYPKMGTDKLVLGTLFESVGSRAIDSDVYLVPRKGNDIFRTFFLLLISLVNLRRFGRVRLIESFVEPNLEEGDGADDAKPTDTDQPILAEASGRLAEEENKKDVPDR